MLRANYHFLLRLLLFAGCCPVFLFAGEIWDGEGVDSKWTTDANWDGFRSGSSPPNNGTANIHFAGNDNTVPNVDIPYSINSLTFDAGSVSFFVTGQELTIGGGGIKNNDNSAQVVTAPVKLADTQTWDAFAGPLTVNGANLNGQILLIRGLSNVNLIGVISGNGSFILNMGAGTSATMSGSSGNTYTGGTSIDAGTLILQKTSGVAIPDQLFIQNSGVVRLGASEQISHDPFNRIEVRGVLDLNGHTETIARLDLRGGVVSTGTGTLIIGERITTTGTGLNGSIFGNVDLNGGDKTITAATSTNLTISGPIANGGVTFAGAGTTLLTGPPNTYTGATVVEAEARIVLAKTGVAIPGDLTIHGTVELGSSNQISTAPSNEVFIDGGTLDLKTHAEFIRLLRLRDGHVSGTGLLRFNGVVTVLPSAGASTIASTLNLLGSNSTFNVQSGARLDVSGRIEDGTIFKTGPGLLDLQNATNTYAGGTFLNGGTLWARNPQSLGAPAVALNFNGGVLGYFFPTIDRPIVWGALGGGFEIFSRVTLPTQSLSGPGPLTKRGEGSLVLLAPQSYTGGTTVEAGSLEGNTQSLQGNIVLQGFGSNVQFVQDNDGIYAGNLSGNGFLGKTGAGTVVLSGNNTNTGGIGIGAGTLELDGGNAVSDIAPIFLFENAAGSRLDLDDSNETIGSLNSIGAIGIVVELGAGTLTTGGDNQPSTFAGVISGTGGIVKVGAGAFTLSGNNTYTGPTSIQAGAIRLEKANALAPTGSVDIAAGARLELNNFDQTISRLTGAGLVALGSGDLTLDIGPGSSNTFAGDIAGAGSLTKTGDGTLDVTGLFSYTGGTTVLAGRLRGPASALQRDIVNHAIVEFAQSTDGTYSGVLSGPGQLVKTGAGKLTLATPATYGGRTTVSTGTLSIPNTLNTPGAEINIGAAGTLEASGIIQRPIAGAGTLTATGNLVAGDINSNNGFQIGAINVGNHAVVLLDANRAAIGGGTIAGGSLDALAGIELVGTFSGHGVVKDTFVNNGTVAGPAVPLALTFAGPLSGAGSFSGNIRILDSFSPGNSPAKVALESVVFGNDATLALEVAGMTAGAEYDQLVIAGNAQLGGVLSVTLASGDAGVFSPGFGDSFDLLLAGQLTGDFERINLPQLEGDLFWNVARSDAALAITVVPEPASLALLIAALAVLVVTKRRLAW